MSRRIGDYSLSGDAIGADGGPSDVRVKSSLYGAYFTAAEEKGGFGVFAAAYAGSYDLTVTAEEGQEEFSGKAYGVDFEVDYAFRLSDEWSITTSTAASAHAVRFDGFTDSSAVSAEFGDIYKAAVTPSVKLGYSTKNDDGRITKAYVSGGYSESLVKNNSVDITSDGERAGYDAMSDGMRGTYAGLGFSTHMGASLLVGVDARKYFGEDDGIAASATARYQFGGESLTNGEWYDEFGHPEEPETMNFPRYFEETITDFRKNDVQLKDPAQLDRIIERIKKSEMDDYIVIVKGYISQLDQNYRSARSKQLILRRAQFVADQLALKGVSSSDIILDIKDAAEQIKTGDEKKDRKMNRRVTVTVVSRVKVKLLPEDEDKSISQLAAETADIINSAERAAGLETPGERAARELEGQRRKEAEAKEALGIAVPAPVSSASGSDDGGD
jgi:outer membrane protein OmpA-like peptidoglycan-associated protein